MKILSPSDMLLTLWGLNTFRAVGSPPYVRNFIFSGSLLGFPSPFFGFLTRKKGRVGSVDAALAAGRDSAKVRAEKSRGKMGWTRILGKKTLEGKVGKDLHGHPVPSASPQPCLQGPHPDSSGTLPLPVTPSLGNSFQGLTTLEGKNHF